MDSLNDALRNVKTLSFDCYGTLINWESGIRDSLTELLGDAINERIEEAFDTYVKLEAEVEAQCYRPYREIIAIAAQRTAQALGVELSDEEAARLPELLPKWKPFPDTNEALVRLKRHYELGILSNIDRDLIAATARHFDVSFDFVVTAQDVGSYKPAHPHFERLLTEHGGREAVIHVGQSLYHDGTATRELDIRFIWINRRSLTNDTPTRPLAEFPDLKSLADAVDAAKA